jgi:Zn-dependent M28 family amino/carboxypeptidase
MLRATNIIASYRPELKDRILICAHWDSRPWADNDPDEANHRKPVIAANDGASGVAVMLEIARLLNGLQLTVDSLQMNTSAADSSSAADASSVPNQPTDISSVNRQPSTVNNTIGIDFICFDAEDWGTPQWDDSPSDGNTWALGSQYWAANAHVEGYNARYGILLDMVGGQGAQFYQEQFSLSYARSVVDKVWRASQVVGFGSYFPKREGVGITDDHLPVNRVAKIPCIDIIPYYPDCEQSSFGPTWHTVNDDMAHIDRANLQAVGQTLVQVLFSE